MKIAEIAPEVAPFSKTGGLADVTGALPHHLAELGAEVVVVSPLHRSVAAFELDRAHRRLKVPMGERIVECDIATATIPGTHVTSVFIDHPDYFDREFLYGPPDGDYPDNAERFSFFARAALEFFKSSGEIPDIVHAHDWHVGWAAEVLATVFDVPLVTTLHGTERGRHGGHLPFGIFARPTMQSYGVLANRQVGRVVHPRAGVRVNTRGSSLEQRDV